MVMGHSFQNRSVLDSNASSAGVLSTQVEVKFEEKEEGIMITKDKFRFSSLWVGIGLGAVGALLLAPGTAEEMWKYLRQRSRRSLDILRKQAGKLRESADVMVKKGQGFVGSRQDSAKNTQEADRQAYEEQKRENPGG